MNKVNNLPSASIKADKKITKTFNIDNYEVLTPDGWVDIEHLHETIEYEVYQLDLIDGRSLKCADNHIVIMADGSEKFVCDLKFMDEVITDDGTSLVSSVKSLGYSEVMYDLQLSDESKRVYYTNGILSHNTELTKQVSKWIFGNGGDRDNLIRLDMNEFSQSFNSSRMIGAPAGYVGYGDSNELTDKVRRNPYSVILFDEIEKAHSDIHKLLLRIMDEGQISDSTGRVVNFRNTVIIMTSNVGVNEAMNIKPVGYQTGLDDNKELERKLKKSMEKKFPPEFLNRLDEVVYFNQLTEDDILKITKLNIQSFIERCSVKNYDVTVSESAINQVAKLSYDPKFNARPINRTITKELEKLLMGRILKDGLVEGGKFSIGYSNADNKFTIKTR